MIPSSGPSWILSRAAAAVTLLASLLAMRAADFNPPNFLTYQGFLADANGVGLAPANPINYDAVFRVYDSQTGGTLIWAERQTITVDKGIFSVLLGEGSANASEPRPAINTVFSGSTASDRFLDITVTVGSTPLNIVPRLRLVASPYAFHARTATSLVSPNGASLVTTANGALTVNGTISNPGAIANSATTAQVGSVGNTIVMRDISGNFVANEVWLGSLHTTFLDAAYVRAAARPGSHLQGAHLEWNYVGQGKTYILNQKGGGIGGMVFGEVDAGIGITERMRIRHDGRVGIGSANPDAYLTVASSGQTGGNNTAVFIARGINNGAFASHLHYGSLGDIYWRSAHPSGKVILQDTGGNVGIGTASPTQRLHVNGIGQFSGGVQIGAGIATGYYGDGANIALRTYPNGAIYFQTASGATTPMFISPVGNVGIGTLAPGTWGKLEVHGGPSINGIVGSYINGAVVGNAVAHGAHNISIYATHGIWSSDFVVASDSRIKRIEGRSDSTSDLETLRGIEITNYRYKDVISRGNRSHKKVIAQQMEKVFPQAINKHTGAVPDIYKPASFKDGLVNLQTDLKIGERVKLISENDEGSIHEVLELTPDGFRIDYKPKTDKVFVFGREVDDFRVVDYDAIAMLNVSATQELAKQVDELRKSEARIAELELKASRVDKLEREVAELKQLVAHMAGLKEQAQTVSESEPAIAALGASR